MKKVILLGMGVLALSFLTNTDSQKASANSPLISESENNLISTTAELRSIEVTRYKYFKYYDYPLGVPTLVWHEEYISGEKMVGYLSLVGATGRHEEYKYKGTLYNAKYSVPSLGIIEENQ